MQDLVDLKARKQILALEAAFKNEIAKGKLTETTNELPLFHHFIPGAYARELRIPAGTLVVGKIHKGPCFNLVLEGEIEVITEEGRKRIKAPAFFRSEGGVKRVGFAITDTVWINIHGTQETDLEKLEEELIAPDYEALKEISA